MSGVVSATVQRLVSPTNHDKQSTGDAGDRHGCSLRSHEPDARALWKSTARGVSRLSLNRYCVLFVAACSLGVAYAGQSAYELLEGAYAIGMVALFVPLAMGIYTRPQSGVPAVASMLVGFGAWLPQYLIGWDNFLQPLSPFDRWPIPIELAATALAFAAYLSCHLFIRRQRMHAQDPEAAS